MANRREFRRTGVRPGDRRDSGKTALGRADLAATLWSASADLADACRQSAFVRGIADGSLATGRFRAYVAQDAYFLEAFARAYALALAHSPDRHGLDAFHA